MPSKDLLTGFGRRLFDDRVMRECLPIDVYDAMRAIRDEGRPWQPEVADVVADAMKKWAMGLGATHYIHWFSPITGSNSGKHDGFIDGVKDGDPILSFSGKMLSQSEPDASSFPSGGLRATFEARGYTAWDPTSPAFVLGTTLYIPTAFCAYTGEALDQKTPVLRSLQVLNKQALRVLRAMGDTATVSVHSTVGAEQEYFLVDKELYDQRLDLKICGHTLIGAKPPKGQEMEDHYYGSISERVRNFMRELDDELWALGVPAKTEHNEVAPGQYELASVFSTANIACDHNQVMMELMRKVAVRHGLACILHEKPFEGVNGSGKHDNWSLVTNNGKNLLSPGEHPESNWRFLLFLSAIYTAVDEYADLLRLSATCPGNDYRLGANEAPPAIISIFLGEALTSVLHSIAHDEQPHVDDKGQLLTGVKSLPLLKRDDNDRNRTSPFAFTGNKFEFRMVGSSQSIGFANAVINATVADTLRIFADRLENAADVNAEIKAIVQDTYKNHNRIIFNGNNYSNDWVEEAAQRGLPNIPNMVSAVPAFISEKNVALFERTKVFTAIECHSRYEVLNEYYSKIIHIDINTMLEMVNRSIIPAAYDYLGMVAKTNHYVIKQGACSRSAQKTVNKLVATIDEVTNYSEALESAVNSIDMHADTASVAHAFYKICSDQMLRLRGAVDRLEGLVAESYWPIPSYSALLFDL
ncbi:MAG: glutamine synthetase III [Oscillospiraceae bacterium]|nr:glutamine synthetase III [Oscillospiraceae bacterium]